MLGETLRCCITLHCVVRLGLIQGRIFIFGALGYSKLGALLEGLQRLMSYKLALHMLIASRADPASEVRGTISVILASQGSGQLHYCKRVEAYFTILL